MRTRSIVLLGWLMASHLLSACAGHLRDGVYSRGEVRYRIGPLPPAWTAVGLEGNDVAFFESTSGHSLAVNATCEGFDDPPLEVLTRHLLMGFTQRVTILETTLLLDGRAALRSHVSATLDGVPVELVLVVLKKNGCVYDFTLLAPPGQLAPALPTFDALLATFHVAVRT
jgi:hypothetical protein